MQRPSIIFGTFKGMGDLLWAAPVLSAELERGCDVHLLIFPGLAGTGFCDLVDFGPHRDRLFTHVLPRGLRDALRFLHEVRRLSPELVWLSPHAPAADSSWKVPLAMRLLQRLFWPKAVFVGAASERLSGLFDRRLEVERTLPLNQREWSAYRLLRGPALPVRPPAVHFLPEIAALRQRPPAYDVVVHPGAGAANRIWPLEYYAPLLAALPASWKVAVLALPEDLAVLRATVSASAWAGPAIEYVPVGESLRKSLETVAAARTLLVMNSGTMHFAQVLGVPALAIFGQQNPAEVIAGDCIDPIYERSVACQPCNRATCSQPQVFCLTHLHPERVAARLVALWSRVGPDSKNPLVTVQAARG